MSSFRFSVRELFLLTLVAALLFGWGTQTYIRSWPSSHERALMQERLEALKEVVEVQTARLTSGMLDSSKTLREAQAEAMAMELELCSTNDERLKVLERNLAAQQQYEQIATARFAASEGTRDEVLLAKADRLNAELAMERAKAGR